MIRPQEIATQEEEMAVLVQLTDIFESIASMKIAQIKNEVLQSQSFFEELWQIYSQIRVDSNFHFGRYDSKDIIDKELLIVVTAESSLSGDIDAKLIQLLMQNYDPKKHDIIVIGHHGAVQLAQSGVQFKRYFKLPTKDRDINVLPIIREVQKYRATSAYYQTYVSLMVQDVKRIELSTAVAELGKDIDIKGSDEDIISEKTYIFEPSTYDVIDHLERSMLHIALSQIILDSKLAQYASRFQAMSMAHSKAVDSHNNLHLLYNRAKRAVKDERLKEIINGLQKARYTV